jgi:hypothetical protein
LRASTAEKNERETRDYVLLEAVAQKLQKNHERVQHRGGAALAAPRKGFTMGLGFQPLWSHVVSTIRNCSAVPLTTSYFALALCATAGTFLKLSANASAIVYRITLSYSPPRNFRSRPVFMMYSPVM